MDEYTPNPNYPRRRRKTKMQIIKEAYLPAVFLALTVILVLVFIIGGAVRRKEPSAPETTPPVETSTTVDILQEEADRLIAQAGQLAAEYDYRGAVQILESFRGNMDDYPELKKAWQDHSQTVSTLVTWGDPSQITALSFHGLIADSSKAFVDQSFGTAYNRNFVTTAEFSAILEQLYANGFVLVRTTDYVEITTDADGRVQWTAKTLELPAGKKPLLLMQTNVNYYTYMVDGDGDGKADKDGAGFANRLALDSSGKLTCSMVDSDGNEITGAYDLVPILNAFVEQHPDFSYKGARALLAPSGYDGIFGYRFKDNDQEKEAAAQLVAALKNEGYELACYTYGNVSYGQMGAAEIQTDLKSWTTEIEPVFGKTNILVYAQGSELTAYEGSTLNVLQNTGFYHYFGFTDSGVQVQSGESYLYQKRLTVTGTQMAHDPSVYSGMFDPATVLDPQRGNVPQ